MCNSRVYHFMSNVINYIYRTGTDRNVAILTTACFIEGKVIPVYQVKVKSVALKSILNIYQVPGSWCTRCVVCIVLFKQ